MKRRRVRRKRPGKENSMMKFVMFIGIILATVILGYITARFALGPLLGYDTAVLKLDFPSKLMSQVKEKAVSVTEKETDAEKDGGYVLQFGVFSAKSGAKELQSQLEKEGIDTKMEEDDGKYRVISQFIDTKEEALKQLEKLKEENNIDVFIDTVD